MANATIYDVAQKAGVSISTVSLALNSPEQVQPATRARVMAAVDALGFVPKAEAVARARKGVRRIGVLAPFFPYPSFSQRLRGIATALATTSYELSIYNVDSLSRRDGYFASLPVTGRVDGLITMALPIDEPTAHRFLAHKITVVLLEYTHPAFSSLEIDDAAGMRLVAEHLVARGYRRCAYVGDASVPPYTINASAVRLAAYRHALAELGQPLAPQYVSLAPHSLEHAEQQAHQLLDMAEPPDAIFAPSDIQAMGVLKAVRDRGLRPKSDVAVIGFDDIDMAGYTGLTTVRQPLDQSGTLAVELLIAQLQDSARPVQHTRLPLALVLRDSA